MISAASDMRCSRPISRRSSGAGGKPRPRDPIERTNAGFAERHAIVRELADVTRESMEVEAEQDAAVHLVASSRQERMPAFHVAIDEMLEADGHLDDPLERHAVTSLGP